MFVTVLLSTRNRANRLVTTLETLSRLQVPDGVAWEVVVADNGSTDHTAEVLAAWAARLPLCTVWAPEPGLSAGRNAALRVARGELVLFTDDDVRASSGWLAEYVAAFLARGRKYFFGGPVESDFEGPVPDAKLLRFTPPSVRGLDWGTVARPLRPGEYFIGPNWACAADLVRQLGGFDTRMGLGAVGGPQGGEETDLMERLKRMGVHGWYVPDARLTHWVPAEKTKDAHIKARWEALATVKTWKARTSATDGIPWKVYADLGLSFIYRLAALVGLHDRVAADMRGVWSRGVYTAFRLPPRPDGATTHRERPGAADLPR